MANNNQSTMIEFEPTANTDLISSLQQQKNYHSINMKDEGSETSISSNSHSSEGRPIGKSSITSVLWNFLNLTVGIGILSLPFAIVNTGLISCIIGLILFGFICTYTLNILVISAHKASVYNYEALAEYCFGTTGYIITVCFIFIMVFGGLITEFIAIGDASFKIIQIWGYDSPIERQIIMVVISSIVVLPLCLFRDLSSLEHVSAFKVASICFIVAVVIYDWWTMTDDESAVTMTNMDMNQITILNISGLPATMGIIAFSFLCHDCTFLMYNTLENPTISRWKTVSSLGIGGTIALNLLFAIPAFLTFGQDSQPNIINNYPVNSALFIAVRIIIVVIMALSYPPGFYLLRHIVYDSSQKAYSSFMYSPYRRKLKKIIMPQVHDQGIIDMTQAKMYYTVHNAPLSHHVGTTLVVFIANLGIAVFVNNLGVAMSFIGSVASMNIELVIPALCFIKICWNDKDIFKEELWNKSSLFEKGWMILRELSLPILLVILGIGLSITGALSSLNLL